MLDTIDWNKETVFTEEFDGFDYDFFGPDSLDAFLTALREDVERAKKKQVEKHPDVRIRGLTFEGYEDDDGDARARIVVSFRRSFTQAELEAHVKGAVERESMARQYRYQNYLALRKEFEPDEEQHS